MVGAQPVRAEKQVAFGVVRKDYSPVELPLGAQMVLAEEQQVAFGWFRLA